MLIKISKHIFLDKSKLLKWPYRDSYTPFIIAALFTKAKLWIQPKCSSTLKICSVYTMVYSVIMNEIILFSEKWMELEIIMISK
jgi:hypothetical protein